MGADAYVPRARAPSSYPSSSAYPVSHAPRIVAPTLPSVPFPKTSPKKAATATAGVGREEYERARENERALERQLRDERDRERRKDAASAAQPDPKPAADDKDAAAATAAKDGKEAKEVPKRREHTRPPQVIIDEGKGVAYRRIGFLGEGGFARVYEALDDAQDHKAIKVVNKSSIRTKRNKTKLWAEIKLHQMLKHPNVVRFDECFEDADNVYMVLELCDNGSLMDLLRRRKRYTEPEARFFLVQLIGACQYMHDMSVIHRDLKLGNLFLDRSMNVKVGDFGLAALIENPGDRKKTICGTPNYIAPEVLFDQVNGHSFEVDVWSVGVILYTLIIGKPPFQTKEVKAIYRRIRDNRYEFPEDKQISESAQNLIMSILNTDPEARPTLDTILRHPWFLDGPFPATVPVSANDVAPDFSHLSAAQSRRNFEAARRRAVGAETSTTPPAARPDALGPSILAQERDFKAAVEPGSPISALLNSARQPLVQAPAGVKEGSLLRKLSAAGAQSTHSPVRRGPAAAAAQRAAAGSNPPGPSSRPPAMDNVVEEEDEGVETSPRKGYAAGVRDRELAAQKARIVSEMAAMRISDAEGQGKEQRKALGEAKVRQATSASAFPLIRPATTGNTYDRLEHNLTAALNAYKEHGGCRIDVASPPPRPKVFVVSWLDYCAKYGMGFAMSDGTVSVHFNDSSSVALAPGKSHFDYIDEHQRRSNYIADAHPDALQSKVYLLHKFESYMLSRLCGDYEFTWTDAARTTDMVYIEKYLRTKNVILFLLSNGILQFNFYDHTKLILSSDGLVVSVIDKHYAMHTWSLADLLGPPDKDKSDKERHRQEKYITKVEYARSLLARMRAHGGMGAAAAKVQEKERAKGPSAASTTERAERAERTDDRRPIRG